MASKDLDGGTINKEELDDMTTCCICSEVFSDPKAFPCIHTFCMKCIQETGLKNNKGPGDEMPCPTCRRLFKIPSEGFCGLPKNFFIERLIQASNISHHSASSRTVCDASLDDNKEEAGKKIPEADAYCVECKLKLCQECCTEHRKLRFTKNHKLMPMTEHEGGQNVTTDLVPSVCQLHKQKALDVYCADCKTVVCAFCFIDGHKNHEGSDVNKFVDGFQKQMQSNSTAINECRTQAEMKKAELLKVKEDIEKRVEALECDTVNRKDEVKQLTDKHTSSLLLGLSLIRQSKLKEIQVETGDIDTYLLSLETYNSYCQKILAKGSASDICRAFSDLSVRAVELQEQCQPVIEREIQSFNHHFRKSELEEILKETCENLIGEIKEEGDSKPNRRSKESLLAEQSKEIDLLRKEIEIERTEKESLRLVNEQLRISINNEIQGNKALKEELDKEKANYDSCTVILKQEVDKNKTTNSTLQADNDKLKQDLDNEKVTNSSLQTNIDQLKKELENEKTAKNSLQADKDKLKQDLDNEKLTKSSLQTNIGELKKELENENTAKNSLQADKNKLKQDLDNEKLTNSSLQTNIGELNQELDKEKTAKNSLQADKDKLKQDLNKEKLTSNSVQANSNKLVQEVYTYKTTIETLEDNVEKLKQELEKTKIDTFRYKSDPVLVQTIRTKAAEERKKPIVGLTILDKELFVLCALSSEVDVYDSIKLSYSRRWNLKELYNPQDIASCNRNKCLYIVDYTGNGHSMKILRVDPNGKLIKNWSAGDSYVRVSVTGESNVILTVGDKNKLNEYSPDGELIREINLSSGILNPRHAIKLANGQFVVSHGIYDHELHRVCVVDADGKLKKSFGGKCGSAIGQMKDPIYLSVDGNGFVMVTNRGNGRVLLLDPDLEFKREILSGEKHGLRQPNRILVDDSNGRLFVTDNERNSTTMVNGDGRILIFSFN